MAYNFESNFQNQSQQPVNLDLNLKLALLKSKLKKLKNTLDEFAKEGDKESVIYLKFLIYKNFLSIQQNMLNDLYNYLTDELIDSKDANSPSVLERRKEIAQQINEILEIEEILKVQFEKQDEIEMLSKLIPIEKRTKAEKVFSQLNDQIENIVEPPSAESN